MFSFLQPDPHKHLKRASVLLREAHLARIEHQAAAEHHRALARMYEERVARLEREISQTRSPARTAEDASPALARPAAEKAILYPLDARRSEA